MVAKGGHPTLQRRVSDRAPTLGSIRELFGTVSESASETGSDACSEHEFERAPVAIRTRLESKPARAGNGTDSGGQLDPTLQDRGAS